MTFKKFFRQKNKEKGQAALEYFIVFSVIALITIISLSSFFVTVKQASSQFFRAAAERIVQ